MTPKLLKGHYSPTCSCSICDTGLSESEQGILEYAYRFGICLALGGLMLIAGCFGTPAHAYTNKEAIKTIVGESANQGFKGMVCVGEVLRHRAKTGGFYGLYASHSIHEPTWVWNMAKKAWYASKHTNYTRMADHFENIHAFGRPYWVKSCVKTFAYKDHVFYREI